MVMRFHWGMGVGHVYARTFGDNTLFETPVPSLDDDAQLAQEPGTDAATAPPRLDGLNKTAGKEQNEGDAVDDEDQELGLENREDEAWQDDEGDGYNSDDDDEGADDDYAPALGEEISYD